MQSLIGFPNLLDDATLAGGSWEAAAPVTQVGDVRLHRIAQSTDDDVASTIITADLGSAMAVRIAGLVLPNASRAVLVRVTCSAASDFTSPVLQTDWLAVYPASFTAVMWAAGLRAPFTYVATADTTARYWRFELDDDPNPDTYLTVARAWLSPAWLPSQGMLSGAEIGLLDSSERKEGPSGATYVRVRPQRRQQVATFAGMTDAEAMTEAWRLQRMVGLSEQVWWVMEDGDTYQYERAFLARMGRISPLRLESTMRPETSFSFIEEI